MLKKIISVILSLGIISSAVGVLAEEEAQENKGKFICLRNGFGEALTNNKDGELVFTALECNYGKGMETVSVTIQDNRSYLPLRWICNYFGLKDLKESENKDEPNGYRYDGAENGKKATITLSIKGKEEIIWEQDKVKVEKDDNNEYKEFINIDGKTYVPLREISEALGKECYYGKDNFNIYVYDKEVENVFLEPNKENPEGKSLIKDKIKKNIFLTYPSNANQINYSDIYLTPKNKVQYLTGDLNPDNPPKNVYYSVNRVNNTLYFLDENKHIYSYELFVDGEPKRFYIDGQKDLMADQIVCVGEYLYGIEVDNVESYTGNVFKVKISGREFKTIDSGNKAFNLITVPAGTSTTDKKNKTDTTVTTEKTDTTDTTVATDTTDKKDNTDMTVATDTTDTSDTSYTSYTSYTSGGFNIAYVTGEKSNKIYTISAMDQKPKLVVDLTDVEGVDADKGIYFMVMYQDSQEKTIVYADNENGDIYQLKYNQNESKWEMRSQNINNGLMLCSINADTISRNAEDNKVYFLYQNDGGQRKISYCTFNDIGNMTDIANPDANDVWFGRLIKLTVLDGKVYATENSEMKQITE